MSTDLSAKQLLAKQCVPCRGGLPPLTRDQCEALLPLVPGWELAGWELADGPPHLERSFSFHDFAEAQAFAVRVGALAEDEGHHPDLRYGWGYCAVRFWTHKINGLHDNDFIMAAKVNGLAAEVESVQIGG
ncbi:putative pterin-4-alpha-carbinolamine dehydratase [uncultured Gammaproteobacteria bacterium]